MNYVNQKTLQGEGENNSGELLQKAQNEIETISKWRDKMHGNGEPGTREFEKCVSYLHDLLRKLRISIEGNELTRPQDTSRIMHKINYSEDKRSHVLGSIIILIQDLIMSECNRLQKRTMGAKEEIHQTFQKTNESK